MGVRDFDNRLVKQQLELVTQAHGARDALAILRYIVSGQQERINGRDLSPISLCL